MKDICIFNQAPFVGRENFHALLTDKHLYGKAVEIGTNRGEFAQKLIGRWSGVLYCVDPYINGYDHGDPASYGDREKDYHHAQRILKRFGSRVNFIRATSKEAVDRFEDDSLDFIYVDGHHRYASVVYDLTAWWPKLHKGGIMAGHDILCPGEKEGGWAKFVQPAVMEHADKYGVIVYLVLENNNSPWSYYMVKP